MITGMYKGKVYFRKTNDKLKVFYNIRKAYIEKTSRILYKINLNH